MTIYTGQVGDKTNRSGGLMDFQLSLTEYSAKYKVSISTLRRRIKKGELVFIQESGKYMLPNIPYDELLGGNTAPPTHNMADRGPNNAPPQESIQYSAAAKAPFLEPLGLDLSFMSAGNYDQSMDEEDLEENLRENLGENISDYSNPVDYGRQEGPVESRSEELIELKKAYTAVLSEKEEQILQLKQHIVDLQTLNKALDSEVDRLKESNSLGLQTSFMKHSF